MRLSTAFQLTLSRWLAPATCVLCDAYGSEDIDLCHDCIANFPRNDVCCRCCALPLQTAVAPDAELLCGACIKGTSILQRAAVPYLYRAPVDHMVKRLKFSGDFKYARLAAHLITRHIGTLNTPLPDALIAVPIHPRRLRERGFNQSALIAKAISRQINVPHLKRSASRVLHLPAQTQLGARARERNMRHAFTVHHDMRNRDIGIVDDVMTTGATARSLAHQLRKSGARSVSLWALARTPQ